ncbi:MAG: hypothetical protein K0R84_2098, partial [Clostridia bacterium]|nr:hypothetical protein [Clostridia bacterium]
MEFYRNDYLVLTREQDKLFIQVTLPGFDIRDFNEIISEFPVIHLTNFISLRKALVEAKGESTEIGCIKPRVEVIISSDEMQTSVYLN